MSYTHYEFQIKPLPYAFDALEPYIDTKTMELHHNKHLKAYVDNLNKLLFECPRLQKLGLADMICICNAFPIKIRKAVHDNAGGIYNHNFYFYGMSPCETQMPIGNLACAIKNTFGSFEKFKEDFKAKALSVFGSGYAWLVLDNHKKLLITTTANQDTVITMRLCPILNIDVWEHAYYLKNYNKRGDYVDNWFNVVNWELAEEKFNTLEFK